MMIFRLLSFPIVALLTLFLVIYQAILGNWLNALIALLLGPVVALSILLGFMAAKENAWLRIGAYFAFLLGIFAIISEHRAFDLDLSKAHTEAFIAFAESAPCRHSSKESRAIFEEGLRACALQDKLNQLNAVGELQKAVYFGPELSFIDQVHSSVSKKGEDWCGVVFTAAERLCPDAFIGMSQESRSILRAEGDEAQSSN